MTTSADRRYYALIASLPALTEPVEAEKLPIAEAELAARLRTLEPAHAREVEAIRDYLSRERQLPDRADEDLHADFAALRKSLATEAALAMMDDWFDFHLALGCLRRRQRGQEPPEVPGPTARFIQQRWEAPDFHLGGRFPWLAEALRHLTEENWEELEELVARTLWQSLSRRAERSPFAYSAVLAYVLRWELLSNWAARDPEEGRRRFEQLIEEVLGDHAGLFG